MRAREPFGLRASPSLFRLLGAAPASPRHPTMSRSDREAETAVIGVFVASVCHVESNGKVALAAVGANKLNNNGFLCFFDFGQNP